MSEDASRTIEVLVRARYPILAIPSYEEERVESVLFAVAQKQQKKMWTWTITRGIHEFGSVTKDSKKLGAPPLTDPVQALQHVMDHGDPSIFLFKDFHPYVNQHEVIRKLRDLAEVLKSSYKTLVLCSPHLKIPSELEKDVTVVDFPMPTMRDLHHLLSQTIHQINEKTSIKINPKQVAVEPILRASLGLTLKEAENVFAKAVVLGGRFTEEDIPHILEEKRQLIRKSGLLEYYPAQQNLAHVGGLNGLKEWLSKRKLGFSEKARAAGLPFPRGVLLVGVQGCGKSLCAKAVSGLWQLPLLRFDVGRVFSSHVGSSEENMREAIRAAESVAPAILWIDEIEKAFSGVESSTFSDGGTAARVFGSFITWLQEKRSPVFVIATANNIRLCPPELMRKGRLDEIFFIDLPSPAERRDIFTIHLSQRRIDPQALDLSRLASATDGFNGAEIEQVIVSAMFDAYEQGAALTNDFLIGAIQSTVPLSRTMAESINELRRWAETRARPASYADESVVQAPRMRKVEL